MVATKKPAATTPTSRKGETLEYRWPLFGKMVDEKLTKAGLKNPAVAKMLGVTTEMARRYRGGFAMAEGDNLKRLSKLTGIDIQTLLMADRGGTSGKAVPEARKRLAPEEAAMLEEFRLLPPEIQKLARARVIELLEEFGPSSKKIHSVRAGRSETSANLSAVGGLCALG